MFKARTWKELVKLAEQSESIKKAVLILRELTEEEKIRLQCEARERYRMDIQSTIKTNWEEGRKEGFIQGWEEGIQQGREERRNMEYEKKRADEAEKREKKLRELLEKNGISLKE